MTILDVSFLHVVCDYHVCLCFAIYFLIGIFVDVVLDEKGSRLSDVGEAWHVRGLNTAGLSSSDCITAYVREQSKTLWNTLCGLQSGSQDNYRGCWVTGPPGIGKSTEVWGWGLWMSTQITEQRKNMLWVHQTEEYTAKFVKVIDGIISAKELEYNTPLEFRDCLRQIMKECSNISLIILDGIMKDMKAHVIFLCREFNQVIVVACTSYQAYDIRTEEIAGPLAKFDYSVTMDSWTLADYKECRDKKICFSGLSDNDLEARYYVAGGSMRLMQLGIPDATKTLDYKLSKVENKSVLLRGMGGPGANNAVNTLLSLHCGQTRIVSQYVMVSLSRTVDDAFITEARSINRDNPSWQGWVFELLFLKTLRKSTKVPICDAAGTPVIPAEISRCLDYDGTKLEGLVSGTLYIPTRWNQGCFDAVFYYESQDVKNFVFMNATIAASHDYKFRYLAYFLEHTIGTPAARELAHRNVRVTMAAVVSESAFDKHVVENGAKEDKEYVQNFDAQFNGDIMKWKLTTNNYQV